MRRRFFVDRFDTQSASLHGDAAEHLGRVLRAAPGQLYELSDGQRVWLGRVEQVTLPKRGENRIDFSLVQPVDVHQDLVRVHVLLSLVKFDRFEWCLEKATELGASEITPLLAARTDKPLIGAALKRRGRWEKILVESAQQARRLRPPVLGMTSEVGAAFSGGDADLEILLSERPDAPPIHDAIAGEALATTVALAVGPEGGWTDEEIALAREAGFQEASLGENILRTETAVIAAMSIIRFGITRGRAKS